jgi:hypothetical protein
MSRRYAWLAAATAALLLAGAVPSAAAASTVPAALPTAGPAVPTAAATAPSSVTREGRMVPADSGKGRRIVYSRPDQHVWILDKDGLVIRDFPVTGRSDWPRAGKYRVFSKSEWSHSPTYGVSYRYMVRFTYGNAAPIGFHSIPVTGSGRPIQTEATLGQALGLGGCVRSAWTNATFIYRWAGLGTRVVVL